jgi:hypothetical protein
MKKHILTLLLLCIASTALFGFELSVPNEISAYQDLVVTLSPDPGMNIAEARFYFLQEGKTEPVYAQFELKNGAWTTVISYKHLKGEELNYYVQVLTSEGTYPRVPETGYRKARLVGDTKAPSLVLLKPGKPILEKGKEQLVVFQVVEDSEVEDYEILYNNKPITDAILSQNKLAFLITPSSDRKDKEAVFIISMVDYFNNKSRKEYVFSLGKAKAPFFGATADYKASLDAEYVLGMGETTNTTNLGAFFSDMTHDVNLKYELSGETKLKAGPLALELALGLGDDISAFDLLEAYPNTLIADYQNIMNLWHPWNFANEFDYTGEVPRKFYNKNNIFAKFSIFDPILSYTFGDQKMNFQTETVKDLAFRGSALSLDTPFLNVSVGKGLSDLGLYETAWPQNFFGLQAGIGVFDYWWLQTNLSLISSLQGRYDVLMDAGGTSAIGALYNLGTVLPEENLVFGLGTGTANKLFSLTAGLGLSLYADDASQLMNIDQLATDINDGFGFDISPYLGYVDTVTSIFPFFDYFPLTDGLAVKALNRELWGITYGADLEVPAIGLKGWFHKTDGSYKSLGASVDTDVMDIGGTWEMPIGAFDLSLGYDWQKDNIPDILFTDLLPLFIPSLASTAESTENDISNLTHKADFKFGTQPSNIFSSLLFTYSFEYASTNAAKLAEDITLDADKNLVLYSTKNDAFMSHTGGLQMKSGRIKLGDFYTTLGAKTEDTYFIYSLVDGASSSLSYFDLAYAVDATVQYKHLKLNLGFEHKWSTQAATDVKYGYNAKFTIAKGFFDTVSFSGSFDQEFNSSALQVYGIGGGATLAKKLGIVDMGLVLKVGYVDSLLDNSDDALTALLTVTGGISL